MQFDQDKDRFIIYLEKDDRIMESLTDFCKDQNIDNGKISGIGAIKDIELGAYDLSNKKYITHNFNLFRYQCRWRWSSYRRRAKMVIRKKKQ